jgi:diguanylate cyclase
VCSRAIKPPPKASEPGRDNTADLLRRADGAVLTAKRAAGNRVVVCTDDISRNVVFRNDIELHLKAGIDSDALLLYYLPEVDLCTGAILGVEALAIAFATSVAVYDRR